MAQRLGICSICGRAAVLALCMLCGAAVCQNCVKEGVCINCRKGRRR